jgi:predicted peptidase
VTLPPDRRRAYTLGALTGAFGALAVVGDRRRLYAVVSVVCGALAVGFEERATGEALAGASDDSPGQAADE